MSKKILLKRSNQKERDGQPKLPLSSQIDYGELAINYAKDAETLAIKNSENEIVAFNKINIVQTSGSSTSNVMSQNAVTTELNKKANKATTLAGYGITDAKIEDGSITIGKETIKPLTSVPSEYVTDDELSAKGYQTASQVSSAISNLVDSAPETLNTLNELAAALGDDPNFATTITNQIAQKADASDLDNYATTEALTSGLAGKANTSHTHTIASITDLQTTLNGKANTSHTHTIANITDLQDALNDKADASDLDNYATTEALTSGLAGKANTSHTHTVAQINGLSQNKLMVSDARGHPSVLSVTSTEASYLSGVTSGIQKQLNGKAATGHSHSAAQIAGLTAKRALVSDGSGVVSTSNITDVELGYLDGVSSNIQTQLNNKANIDHTHEIADINGLDGAALNNMMSYYKFIHSAQNLQSGSPLTIPATNFNHLYQWTLPDVSTALLIVLPGEWFNDYDAMADYYGWEIIIMINNSNTSSKTISFNTMNPNLDANLIRVSDTFTVESKGQMYITLRFGNRFMFVEYNNQKKTALIG